MNVVDEVANQDHSFMIGVEAVDNVLFGGWAPSGLMRNLELILVVMIDSR